MKSYFDKLLLEKEINEMGTDFASPDDRQSAMYASLQGEMQGMMPDSQEIPMEPINDIVEADNAPNDQDRLKEMVKEYVKMRQEPQRFQDGGNVNEEMPLDELRLQQGMYEEEMDEKERGSFEDRQKRAIRKLEDEIDKKYKESDSDTMLNWLTAIGAAARPLKQPYLPDTGKVNYWGSQNKKRFEENRKNKIKQLSDLQNMYQSLKKGGTKDNQYFNTADGIVSVNKKTGETKLVRESELKKQREERLRDQFEFGKEVKGRLSDKEVKDITALDDGSRILEEIDNLLENTEVEDYLGPYSSRIENMMNYVPTAELDENFVKMQQLVGIQLADYVKSISGAQVSEQEAQRLLKNIPNVTDKPKAFKVKLDQFKKELKDARSDYLKNIGKQKKSAEKFMDSKSKEDPKIKKFAQDHNLDYNRAERILRARGYDG